MIFFQDLFWPPCNIVSFLCMVTTRRDIPLCLALEAHPTFFLWFRALSLTQHFLLILPHTHTHTSTQKTEEEKKNQHPLFGLSTIFWTPFFCLGSRRDPAQIVPPLPWFAYALVLFVGRKGLLNHNDHHHLHSNRHIQIHTQEKELLLYSHYTLIHALIY